MPLEGRVSLLDGAQVAGAIVTLQNENDLSDSIQTVTDEEGRFSAGVDSEKTYSVIIQTDNSVSTVTLPASNVAVGSVIEAQFILSGSGQASVAVIIRPETSLATVAPTSAPAATVTATPQSGEFYTPTPLPIATPTPTVMPNQPAFPSSMRIEDVQGAVYAQDGFLDALDIDALVNATEGNTFLSTYRFIHRFTKADSRGRLIDIAIVGLDALDDGDSYEVLFGIALKNPDTGTWVNPTTLVYGVGFSVRFSKSTGAALPASGNSNPALSNFVLSLPASTVSFSLDLRNLIFRN